MSETNRIEYKEKLTKEVDIEKEVNAFVHNDYSKETAPKFELFNDRIEITSAGGLVVGLNEKEFFEGFSIPRNKELIRIFKDLDLVEQLGSGVSRILGTYKQENFQFSDNFLRLNFPATDQVKKLLSVFENQHNRSDLMMLLKLSHNNTFRKNYLHPALELGLIEMTIPDKPKSSKQKYRLTESGIKFKNQ